MPSPKMQYHRWIDDFAERFRGNVRGLCTLATAEMVETFPELRQVQGFILFDEADRGCLPDLNMTLEKRRLVYDSELGLTQHSWCVTPKGEVVDPTVTQYRPGLKPIYVAYNIKLHGVLPSGKCPDCGAIVFPEQRGFCNDVCKDRWHQYMKEELGGPR